jgi:hypothetical protein
MTLVKQDKDKELAKYQVTQANTLKKLYGLQEKKLKWKQTAISN